THYRSPLVFGDQRLSEADAALTRIETCVANVGWSVDHAAAGEAAVDAEALAEAVAAAKAAFVDAMDDDFNAPEALGAVFTLVAAVNTAVAGKTPTAADAPAIREALDAVVDLMGVFGIDVTGAGKAEDDYPPEVLALAREVAGYEGASGAEAVQALLEARAAARKAKNWAVADGVRNGLTALGFVIEDTPQGARISRKA
ncbi:MAG: cysteine--tRNA ligase, partial [Eggerthellaceae bacterium]|nr:cysteine--tRNA ligase [Eggerthellaceae bacterium]